MTEIADSLQVLEKNGGDDGTRSRGLCRDSTACWCNYLISNGVGGHLLIPEDTARQLLSSPYCPQIWRCEFQSKTSSFFVSSPRCGFRAIGRKRGCPTVVLRWRVFGAFLTLRPVLARSCLTLYAI